MPTDLQNDPPVSPTVPLPSGVAYTLNMTDAATTTRTDMLTLHHASTNTLTSGVGGFGAGIKFEGPKVDGTFVPMALIEGGWIDPDTTNPYGHLIIYCQRYGVTFKAAEFKPDQCFLPAGAIANPGIAFVGSNTSGMSLVSSATRLSYLGVSNFAMNDVGVAFCGVSAPVAAQSVLAALTNNIVASGSSILADWTSLTTYSTDAAAIHAAVYQAVKKLGAIETALRNFGLLVT